MGGRKMEPLPFTEEEERLEFGVLLKRIKANDPTLTSLACHETAEDLEAGGRPTSVPFEQRAASLKALAKNTAVTTIDLSYCKFGDAAIAAIASALPPQLRMLRLRDNEISDTAASKLSDCIAKCPNLQLLDFAENNL